MASQAEIEGWNAFENGISKNPYPAGSKEHYDWSVGWERAWKYANGEGF